MMKIHTGSIVCEERGRLPAPDKVQLLDRR